MTRRLLFTLSVVLSCYGDSFTSSTTCSGYDGTMASGTASCQIGPYYTTVNGIPDTLLEAEASATPMNTPGSEINVSLVMGVVVVNGSASVASTAEFDFFSAGPVRPGYAQIISDGFGFMGAFGAPNIVHPTATLSGTPLTLNFSNGNGPDTPYLLPITLGTAFNLVLSGFESQGSNGVETDAGGAAVTLDLFEATQHGPGSAVAAISLTPEPPTWCMGLALACLTTVRVRRWRAGRRCVPIRPGSIPGAAAPS